MKTILKTSLLIFSFVFFSNYSFAAKYYFSTDGDDSRTAAQAQNPATPWKSIDKLNSIFRSLKPGDEVLFKRGDIFYGSINITSSGAQGRPIKISAYGSGAKPIITSLVTLKDWKSVGGGIYESGSPLLSNDVRIVLIDNKIQEIGRYPNRDAADGGYLTITSHTGNGSVSSKDLSSSANFSGGEVVIRKNEWIIDRHRISNHSGNRINYSGLGSTVPTNGYGFFIQGHRNTLDQKGEWFYNKSNKKLNVYFGSQNPGSAHIQVSTKDYLLTKSYNERYITIENLHFKGANKDAIHIAGGRGITIENTDVEYSGENGLTSMSITDLVINNSRVSHSFNNGIYLRYGNQGAKVTNNLVEHTFVFPGSSDNGDGNGVGIFALADNTLIEYNEIKDTGYSAIYFGGNSTVVKNNLIDTYCIFKNDGGGIYGYVGPTNKNYRNRQLVGNIILNGVGSTEGTPKRAITAKGQAEGIFLDDNSNGVEVSGNTISNANNSGIKLANTRNIVVQKNTIYNSNSQILIGNRGRADKTQNLSISDNILFSKYPDQWAYIIRTHKNDVSSFGSFNNNFLYRPLGDPYNIWVSFLEGNTETSRILDLERWKKTFNKDHNSSTYTNPLKKFEVKKVLGGNIFKNSSLDRAISGFFCNSCDASRDAGKLSPGAIKVNSPAYSSVGIDVGSVRKDRDYVLKFKAISNKESALRILLRHSGSPWEVVAPSTTVELGTGEKEYTVLLKPYDNIAESAIMFNSDEQNVTFWMDDIEFREAEVEIVQPKDQFLLEYNATKSEKRIALNGTYVDVKNKQYSGTVTIAPYSSLLLIRTSEAAPKPNYSIQTNIASPKNNHEVEEGSRLVIQAEASATDNSINKVEFFNGNTLLGSSTKSPYSYTWEKVPAGNHKVTAVVTGSSNRTATSEPVTINVNRKEKPEPEKPDAGKPNPGTSNPNPGIGKPGAGNGNNGNGSFSPLYYNIGSSSTVEYQGNMFEPMPHSNVLSKNTQSHHPQASRFGLFQTSDYGKELLYAIPVPNGTYTVQTYHNEVYFGNSGPSARQGQRIFDLLIEGQVKKKDLDMYINSGNKETILTHEEVNVTDGMLNISMVSSVEMAIISGIAIFPSGMQKKSPVGRISEDAILINAGGSADVQYEGNTFVSDLTTRYFSGGTNANSNTQASNDPLFQTHRFSPKLRYDIPVPNGIYTVITYHNETYLGISNNRSGPNLRVFDIYLEGELVKKNLDLFKESSNQPMSLTFEQVQVEDGVINLELVSSVNSATISGIAIINESAKNGSGGANLRVNHDATESEAPELFAAKPAGQIQLYPNPSSDFVTLMLNKDLGNFSLLIHNLNGQLVDHLDPEKLVSGTGGYTIPVHHLKKGVYMITVAGEKEIIERLKLIVGP